MIIAALLVLSAGAQAPSAAGPAWCWGEQALQPVLAGRRVAGTKSSPPCKLFLQVGVMIGASLVTARQMIPMCQWPSPTAVSTQPSLQQTMCARWTPLALHGAGVSDRDVGSRCTWLRPTV